MEYIGEQKLINLLDETPEEDELQLRSSFLMIGEKQYEKYEGVMSTFEAVETIRKSEFRDGVFIVQLKENKHITFEGGLKELRELTGDNSLKIESLLSSIKPEKGHVILKNTSTTTDDEWLASQDKDVQEVNKLVKEKTRMLFRGFYFSPTYRYITKSLPQIPFGEKERFVVSTDFLIGLGFSADDVMEKLIAIEGNMRKSGLKYTWVPVAEVCHLKKYKGDIVVNPIFKSYHSHCLVIPLVYLGYMFSRNVQPPSLEVETYLLALAFAIDLYGREEMRKSCMRLCEDISEVKRG
uniref:Uncharacterized protein n=1 Tax=White spot syndrome virus TaxID=92652 RepID=A5HEW6_WSSV|nr:unknown [White spot syndrome virus]